MRSTEEEPDVTGALTTIVLQKLADKYKPRMLWQEFREKLLCSNPINEIFAEKTTYLARLFKEK
jgi:hypothetical protein